MSKTKEQEIEDKKSVDLAAENKPVSKRADDKIAHNKAMEDAIFNEQVNSATPKTETVAKIDAANEESMHNAGSIKPGEIASSKTWLKDDHGRKTNPNDVKVQVKYPSGWKGVKAMVDGSIQVVSKEVASQFEDLGIAKIVL